MSGEWSLLPELQQQYETWSGPEVLTGRSAEL